MNPSETVTASSASAKLYERAKKVMPGGVSRNTVLRSPHPIYAASASGCRVVDIEGVERIDFANNMASLIHGHAHPEITKKVAEQLQRGTAFTVATEVEVDYAEHMVGRSASFDSIRFVNSGTEGVMAGLKVARAFTGRPKIAKVEGAYHGIYDYAEASQNVSPETWGDVDSPAVVATAHGTPQSVLDDVVIIPFNDVDRAIKILNHHRDQLACILIDPMPHRAGLIRASSEFVLALREWSHANGALLMMDEVITYRSNYGGAQEWYSLTPDLTAMGKMIGGGFPVGAIAGRRDVMEVLNPLAKKVLFPHSGTFSANPITMTAGLASMERFDRAAVDRVNALAKRAIDGIEAAIGRTGATACVTGGGSMFRVHMTAQAPKNYRDAFQTPEESARVKVLLNHLLADGFLMINTCSATISTVMGEDEIDALVASIERGFAEI